MSDLTDGELAADADLQPEPTEPPTEETKE